jgi:hypothetical protein
MIQTRSFMPRSLLSANELTKLITSLVRKGGCRDIAALLDNAPEFKTFGSLMPHEKYFSKKLAYEDFAVHIPFFESDPDSVCVADVQFKRPSGFRWWFGSPSRRLVSKLRDLLSQEYAERGVAVKDDKGGRRIHFNVTSTAAVSDTSGVFDGSASECSIYDEPYSSGQTDPNETAIRNDFVIVRFRRRSADL